MLLIVILIASFIVTLSIFWAQELTTALHKRRSRLKNAYRVDNTVRTVELHAKIAKTTRRVQVLERQLSGYRGLDFHSRHKLHADLLYEKDKLRKLERRFNKQARDVTDLVDHDVRFWTNVRDNGHDVLGDHPLLTEIARQMTEYLADRRSM